MRVGHDAIPVQQRLAALGIDAVTAYVVADRYVLTMRDPEPSEGGVDDAALPYLRIVDLDGAPNTPLLTINFAVYVDQGAGEVLAYDGTIFQPGWNGPGSVAGESTGASPYCYREVTLDQFPAVFASEATITLRVALAVGTGGFGHYVFGRLPFGHAPASVSLADETYTFTVEDTAPLHILRAEGIGPYQVRVVFDDTPSAAALLPATWAIARAPVGLAPVAALTVTACELDDRFPGTAVVLTCTWEQTPSGPYVVTCAGTVTDEAGNALATGTAAFLGWVPDAPATRAWRIWDHMIPVKNRTEDAAIGDLRRVVNCLDEQLAWNLYHVDHWPDRMDPDRASDDQIDGLLADLGNPFAWAELELTALERRRLLRLLVPIYQAKGTAAGIEDTIRLLLGAVCTVVPAAGTGWRLGYDALGLGRVAQLAADPGPYNLLALLPATLSVAADGAAAEVATVTAAAFVDPTAALAGELVADLAAQLVAAVPVAEAVGRPATLTGGVVEPFAFVGGETLAVDVNGTAATATLHAADLATPGAATAAEVAARLTLDLAGLAAGGTSGGAVTVASALTGAGAVLTITGGTMAAALGLTGATGAGTDDQRLLLRGTVAGADHTLAVAAGPLQAALGLPLTAAATGGCRLGAGEQRLRYSFDLEVATPVSAATEALMRQIANYMRPAHTHLLRVRAPQGAPPVVGWRLGEGRMGITTELS